MQFQLEESTPAKESWPLRGASGWWLPQISAALGLGFCKIRSPWGGGSLGTGRASVLSRPGFGPGWQGDISNESRSAKPCNLQGSE